MTAVAASQMANLHGHAGAIVVLILAAVALMVVCGIFFGDFFPMLIFFAAATFDLFVLPRFPGSPVACLVNDNCAKDRSTWLVALLFLVPLGLCQGYKELRGDTRGKKGGRLP